MGRNRGNDGGHVFINQSGTMWTVQALTKYFRAVRKRAGLSSEVKPHGCRHSYATGAIMRGVDIATLASLMGHANISTTQQYTHLADKSYPSIVATAFPAAQDGTGPRWPWRRG